MGPIGESDQQTIYFKLGKLRVGFHGILATVSLILAVYAITSLKLVWLASLLNGIVAWDAYSLLSQVPVSTKIFPGVVAPHREAFKRTMAMMHYANVRIAGGQGWIDSKSILYHGLMLYMWTHFVPTNSTDWSNGNTWIFVVPMFTGVTIDSIVHEVRQYHCVMPDLVATEHYLVLHVAALIMAFAFTLAFRGYLSIQKVYIFCSVCVALLFLLGWYLVFTSNNNSLCN